MWAMLIWADGGAAAAPVRSLSQHSDWPGMDLMKIPNVTKRCCKLCAANTKCSAGSWDGPRSEWGGQQPAT